MKFFEGLLSYEIVLLVMGVILFLFMLVIMVVFVVKQRPIRSLVVFFLLPVVMIGFPSIEKIKFGNVIDIIKDKSDVLAQNPQNKEVRSVLEAELAKIDEKRISRQQTEMIIAKANIAIATSYDASGNRAEAIRRTDKALKIKPELESAKRLKDTLGEQ